MIKYSVLVTCMTYNQSGYILDALNGFVIQKTNFPFVCLVMDDASTDGEQDVIKGFLDRECAMESAECSETEEANIVVVPHKTNLNCTIAVYFLKQNLFGSDKKETLLSTWRNACKYEAFCEGDDFWIDSAKLQKQYDVMEAHPDCAICFNRVQAVKNDGITIRFTIPSLNCIFHEGKVGMKELAQEEFERNNWCFHTSSFFIKTEHTSRIHDFQKSVLPSFPYGDMPVQLYCLRFGGYFLEDTMGCYRLKSGGWNSTMSANPSLAKEMERKVIMGYKEFDAFSGYKYHKEIKAIIHRKEFFILHDGFSFRIKYWDLMAYRFKKLALKILHMIYSHIK